LTNDVHRSAPQCAGRFMAAEVLTMECKLRA
jgi:hypothetical protein